MSWVGDSIAWAFDGSWEGTYLWLPFQFWLIFLAFMEAPANRVFSLGAVVLLALTSWSISGAGPDVLLTLAGSVTVLVIAGGRMALPLRIYFGLGTLAYFVMATSSGNQFLAAWGTYQGCRLLAYTLFLGILFRSRLGPWGPRAAVPH
jgi:hypothetical protein